MAEEPELGIRRDELGMHALGRREYEIRDGEVVFADRGPVGVMVTEPLTSRTYASSARRSSPSTEPYGIHSPTFISRFTDMHRLPDTSVVFSDYKGWSLYGAPWSQPVATGGKWEGPRKGLQIGEKRCGGLRPVAA
jgi:hypothetical protein